MLDRIGPQHQGGSSSAQLTQVMSPAARVAQGAMRRWKTVREGTMKDSDMLIGRQFPANP
jgi:hypothetical protein